MVDSKLPILVLLSYCRSRVNGPLPRKPSIQGSLLEKPRKWSPGQLLRRLWTSRLIWYWFCNC